MGDLISRLEGLEEFSRQEAIDELKEAFDRLTDEEVVLTMAATLREAFGGTAAEPDEAAAVARSEDLGMRELIEAAVRSSERLDADEELRRIREVIEKALYADGRKGRIRVMWWDLLKRDEALREAETIRQKAYGKERRA